MLNEHVMPVLTRALDCVRAAPDDLEEYFVVPHADGPHRPAAAHDGHFIQAGAA